MLKRTPHLSRRTLLKTGAAASVTLAAPAVFAQTSQVLTVAGDTSGTYGEAWRDLIIRPFAEETGIEVRHVPTQENASEVIAMVDTGNYNFDCCFVGGQNVVAQLTERGYLEEIDASGAQVSEIPDGMKTPYYIESEVLASILAYRTDTISSPLKNHADMWNIDGIPGRRSLRRQARDTFETTLRALGKPLTDETYAALLTPEGQAEIFEALEQIAPAIPVWWDDGRQSMTLMQNGEVDIINTFNARMQVPIDEGAPIKIVWNEGRTSSIGHFIPKGAPNIENANRFINYALRPEKQAELAMITTNGPTHPEAIDFVSQERQPNLPTFPENYAQMHPLNFSFWAENLEPLQNAMTEWLLMRG
mgnify:CR=1 FL=1